MGISLNIPIYQYWIDHFCAWIGFRDNLQEPPMKNSWENHGTPWCSPWKIRFTFSQLSIDTPIKSHEIPVKSQLNPIKSHQIPLNPNKSQLNPNEFYHFRWLIHGWSTIFDTPILTRRESPGTPTVQVDLDHLRRNKNTTGFFANGTSVSLHKKKHISF